MAEWRKNMKRVKLIVAYDGTNYHGWQTQPNAVTIEEVLNHHLSELLKEEIKEPHRCRCACSGKRGCF